MVPIEIRRGLSITLRSSGGAQKSPKPSSVNPDQTHASSVSESPIPYHLLTVKPRTKFVSNWGYGLKE